MTQPKIIDISVVIPMFNESECLENTVSVIFQNVDKLLKNVELILVDDGSTDGTLNLALMLSKADPRVRVISLSRNLGHMKALEAGLLASKGELIVSIDADLQDNPSAILDMYRVISEKDEFGNRLYDVVQSVRLDRSTDTLWKRISATFYYKAMSNMTGTQVLKQAADFRMITRQALNIVNQIPEIEKVYRLLLPSLGFRIAPLVTRREQRFAGKSKYNFSKMFRLALESIFSFSKRPLKLINNFGIFSMALMFAYSLFSIYQWAEGKTIPGWTSLVITVLLSNSLILISLGVIGEYVGRLFEQSKGRPSVIWSERFPGADHEPEKNFETK